MGKPDDWMYQPGSLLLTKAATKGPAGHHVLVPFIPAGSSLLEEEGRRFYSTGPIFFICLTAWIKNEYDEVYVLHGIVDGIHAETAYHYNKHELLTFFVPLQLFESCVDVPMDDGVKPASSSV